MKILIITALISLLALSACNNGAAEIQTQKVAKAPVAAAPANLPPQPRPTLRWDDPAGWVKQEAGGMRAGSYVVDGSGDVSIIVLHGKAGGMHANVNRWLGQLNMPAKSPADIDAMAKDDKGKLGEYQWFELSKGPEAVQAMLVAILPRDGSTIFVKFTGPAKLLGEHRDTFLALCRSIEG